MTVYTDLVKVNDRDMDSPTVVATLPPERNVEHYYLPTRMIEQLKEALTALDNGKQQPLVEYCSLFQLWFDQHYPPPHSYLLAICEYDREISIKFYHNNLEKISYLEVKSLQAGSEEVLHSIPVDGLAKSLTQSDTIDDIGDQFFGEGEWQKLKQWMKE